jgi:hypothetical protein
MAATLTCDVGGGSRGSGVGGGSGRSGVSGGECQRRRPATLVMVATFLLLLGVEAMLLFCVSCQLPLRTHCAPILSNSTSAGVVNTTEEKVPNYCFYNTHTWVKKERKKSGGKWGKK